MQKTGGRFIMIYPLFRFTSLVLYARPWDEFKPYRLGGPLRNASEPPMSPLGLPPPYDAIGPAIQAVSAHIHCAVLCPLDVADEDTPGLHVFGTV